jgi:hypothetical protein
MAATRFNAPYAAGAVAPIDDLGAALMALLFHYFWRAGSAPRAAFDQARQVLLTGEWPQGALDVLASAVQVCGPGIVARASADATIRMAEVAELFPGLAQSRLLAHQFRIRRRGRDCLEIWAGCEDVPRWVAGLRDTPDRRTRIQSASRFLSWFG